MTSRVRFGPVAVILALGLLIGGCAAPAPSGPTYPPEGVTPPPAGDATRAALNQVLGALDAAGFEAAIAARPYRPPEAARLAAAPRTVVQVTLTADPARGLLVIYGLDSADAARAAATDQAAYIASGPGRIQFPPDARFVLRIVGSSVVFFAWSPGSAIDLRTGDIAAALETLGTGVAVPA